MAGYPRDATNVPLSTGRRTGRGPPFTSSEPEDGVDAAGLTLTQSLDVEVSRQADVRVCATHPVLGGVAGLLRLGAPWYSAVL